MTRLVISEQRRTAWHLLGLQALLVLLIALFLLIISGLQSGWSAVTGGLAWLLPSVLFTWRVFIDMSPRAAAKIVARFYAAEVMKLLLSAILVIGAIRYLPINFGAFLAGYVGALLSFWLVPLMNNLRDRRR